MNLLTDADSSIDTMNFFAGGWVETNFHQLSPLGRFGLEVAMSVRCCLSPSHAILPGEQRRSQRSKAVSYRGISTLKKFS